MFKIITENNTILIRWLDTKEDWRLPQLKSFNFVGVSKTTSSAGDGKPLFQFHIDGSPNALRLIPSICQLAQGIFGATGWHTPGWDKPGKVCNASCKQDESSMVTLHHDCPAGLSGRKAVQFYSCHPEGIADDSRHRLLPCHQTDDERKGLANANGTSAKAKAINFEEWRKRMKKKKKKKRLLMRKKQTKKTMRWRRREKRRVWWWWRWQNKNNNDCGGGPVEALGKKSGGGRICPSMTRPWGGTIIWSKPKRFEKEQRPCLCRYISKATATRPH